MSRLLFGVLDLRPGEGRRVGLMIAAAAWLGLPRLFTFTTASSLFLAHYGAEALPYVYIGTAVILPLMGLLYLRLEQRVGGPRTSEVVLLGCLLADLGLRALLSATEAGWPRFLAYLWVDIEWALIELTFWAAAARVFTVREGKRLFALLGVGEVATFLAGGALAPWLVSALGPRSLLWLSMAGLGLAVVTLRRVEVATGRPPNSTEAEGLGAAQPFRNRYALAVMGLVAFTYAAFYFVDNLFMAALRDRYATSEAIAAYLGVFFGTVAGLTLLCRSLLAGRWTSRLGLPRTLVSAPALLLGVCASALALHAWGAPAAWLFGSIVALKLGERLLGAIAGPASELLYQPMAPRLRVATRAKAQMVAAQLAGGAVGLLLLLMRGPLALTEPAMLLGLAVLLGSWLLGARSVGAGYHRALIASLRRRGPSEPVTPPRDSLDRTALEVALDRTRRRAGECLALAVALADEPAYVRLVATLRGEFRRYVSEALEYLERLYPAGSLPEIAEAIERGGSERSLAVELLDRVLDPGHRRALLPLFESLTPAQRARRLGVAIPSVPEALRRLREAGPHSAAMNEEDQRP